jgi:hypothetical protein
MMVFATSTVASGICPGFNFGIADTGDRMPVAKGTGAAVRGLCQSHTAPHFLFILYNIDVLYLCKWGSIRECI